MADIELEYRKRKAEYENYRKTDHREYREIVRWIEENERNKNKGGHDEANERNA